VWEELVCSGRGAWAGPWDPLNGAGDNFFLGHSYFPSVSNDFGEGNGSVCSGRGTWAGPWDPLNGAGDDFFLGHSYFPGVSGDFGERERDLKSVMDCPFKAPN